MHIISLKIETHCFEAPADTCGTAVGMKHCDYSILVWVLINYHHSPCADEGFFLRAQVTPMVSGEGDAGSDGGTEEAEREREYVGCKPLAPAEATRIAEAAEAGTASRIGRIFYGSEPLYIFFRLHQLLYDRCAHSLPCPGTHLTLEDLGISV